MSARIGSAWKKFRELSGVLVGKQGLSLKQQGEIYQCCVRPILLYCCETWERTVADEARLRGVERRMIKMMFGVRLVGGCWCEDRGYENSKPSAVVWSCHA